MDEVSDKMSEAEAVNLAAVVMDALRNPNTPKKMDEHAIVEAHRALWREMIKLNNPRPLVLDRFIESYDRCMQAMIQEAQDRETHSIGKTFEEYLNLRQYTGAVKPSFDFLLLPLDIPKELLDDPVVREIEMMAVSLVAVANDIVSFNVEQSRGDIHNTVIVIMKEHKCSVQSAMDMVGKWYHAHSLALLSKCPNNVVARCDKDCGSKRQLEIYIWGLLNWVTANYEWSFGSRRFFATSDNNKIHLDGVVELLAPVASPVN